MKTEKCKSMTAQEFIRWAQAESDKSKLALISAGTVGFLVGDSKNA